MSGVRRATPVDDVEPVVTAAFGPGVGALWQELSASPWLRASLVAEEGAEVVGHVALSHVWVDAPRALVDALVLSPLSVHPSHQRHGVGSSLVAAAVEVARGSTAPLLLLEGDPAYYGRLGFAPASTWDVHPASPRTPAEALQAVRLAGHEPWMTGRVVYPDLWWRHDAVGLR